MDKFDRFQKLHRIFKSHSRPVPLVRLAEQLDCSAVTVRRQIEQMRVFLNAPIFYNKALHGYQYLPTEQDFELPGLWMTSQELQSLVVITNVINSIDEGLLSAEFRVLENQIDKLLRARNINISEMSARIKWIPIDKQFTRTEVFTVISEALLSDLRLKMSYHSYSQQKTQRDVSPQQLIYYRENWYLDAWCHLRKELRSFMLPRITAVEILSSKSKKIQRTDLEEHYEGSYGIFSGKAKHTAKLQFLSPVAREVSSHQWHPAQVGKWSNGDYLLEIPYNKDDELVRDILKYGDMAKIIAPIALKKKIKGIIQNMVNLYT